MDVKRIYRGLDHAYTKFKSWLNERKYVAYGTRVKYMFFREQKSDVLIVSFPAFAPQNIARYNRLRDRIYSSTIRPENVYLHYSKAEHTYDDHIKDMLYDLKTAGINVVEDVHNYPNHGGLKDFYPPFLNKTINELIK